MTYGVRCFAMCLAAVLAVWLPASGGLAVEGAEHPLRRAFLDPPPETRPLIIMHSGPVRNPALLDWLDARRAGGAVIDAGVAEGSQDEGDEPWNNPTYLDDPASFERLREVIAQMRRKGQTVWLYDELGYPSGSAGGRVIAGHPQFQVTVVGCRTFRPEAEEVAIRVEVEHPGIEVCWALPARGDELVLDEAIDLTHQATDGSFTWTPPGADWVVCLLERYQPDTWRRHNIARRNVNILDRDAVARFIQLTHDRYARELGDQLQEVELFFTDEPQFGSSEPWMYGLPETVPAIQWCPRLADTFEQQKGYSLRAIWPALFHNCGPRTSKYRFDFYDVHTDIVAEDYYGQIEQWCHRHGVASSGHMLLEESLLFHVMYSGSMIKNWARMDLPGVDLLGTVPYKTMGGWNHNIIPVSEDFSCKLAASVAHLLGKRGVFTETYAVAQNPSLRQVLGVAAWQFSGGITHMSTYTIQQQLSAEDYASFADFAGRLALLCRRGQPMADVAVLVPEPAVWAAYKPPVAGLFPGYARCNPEPIQIDHVFRQTCHTLLKRQRDFECFSDDFLHQASIADGRLQLADQQFAFLLVPEARMVHPQTLEKIAELLASGGHVVFIGSLPSQSTTVGADPQVTAAAQRLLAEFPQQARWVADLNELGQVVEWMAERVEPAVQWSGSPYARLLWRHEDDRDILLVANPSASEVAGTVKLPRPGTVSIWNPETGAIDTVGQYAKNTAMELTVPGESARLVVVE